MFLKAGSGCGWDRVSVSGCRSRESDAGRHGHGGWLGPACRDSIGCGIYRAWLPGTAAWKARQHTVFLSATRVPCQPARWPSLPCQL